MECGILYAWDICGGRELGSAIPDTSVNFKVVLLLVILYFIRSLKQQMKDKLLTKTVTICPGKQEDSRFFSMNTP